MDKKQWLDANGYDSTFGDYLNSLPHFYKAYKRLEHDYHTTINPYISESGQDVSDIVASIRDYGKRMETYASSIRQTASGLGAPSFYDEPLKFSTYMEQYADAVSKLSTANRDKFIAASVKLYKQYGKAITKHLTTWAEREEKAYFKHKKSELHKKSVR